MTHPLNAKIAGVVFACVASVFPVVGFAQTLDAAPSGSFTFGNLGAAEVEALPLEMAPESQTAAPRTARVVTEVAPLALPNQVQTSQVRRQMIRDTWAIGVFR
jgi:hypothetical protein